MVSNLTDLDLLTDKGVYPYDYLTTLMNLINFEMDNYRLKKTLTIDYLTAIYPMKITEHKRYGNALG